MNSIQRIAAIVLLTLPVFASAQLVTNGGFEGGPASNNSFNSTVPAPWYITNGSPDTWVTPMPTTGTGVWGGLADGTPPSPDGGNFVAAGTWFASESFAQNISGLVIGQQYILSFYQANVGLEGAANDDLAWWEVDFAGVEWDSQKMAYLGEGNQVWIQQSHVFTATSVNSVLEFATNSSGGKNNSLPHAYMGLDGVSLTVVPEPATNALIAIVGLAALVYFRRRK